MAPSGQDEQSTPAGPVALPGTSGDATAPALSFALTPTWVSASIARERVGAWLHALRWPLGPADDLVLAVSEAVSNSVEHGFLTAVHDVDAAGRIDVDAHLAAGPTTFTRQVVVTVRDGGLWRGRGDRDDRHRGHGMHIMRMCTSAMSLATGPEGTTVVLVSVPVPTISRSV